MQMAVFSEVTTRRLWIEVLAEFVITTLFISFVCGCSLSWNPPSSVMHMAISSGLGVATFAFAMWDVSSGLFNPALTIAFFVGRKKTIVQTLLYIVAQLALAVEIWITFILVLVVFAAGDPDRNPTGYGPPLAIGDRSVRWP
ncbi:hypothetical protein QZH41_005943 [Actinostola sp. cb2023]|nr:hypothetical protein QZH41_005943 [Actinostola sp. cb2023]